MANYLLFSLLILILLPKYSFSQVNIDSLILNYNELKVDSLKSSTLIKIIDFYLSNEPRNSRDFIAKLKALAIKTNNYNLQLRAALQQSTFLAKSSDLESSNKVLFEALNTIKSDADPNLHSNIYLNLGINYLRMSNYNKSIDYLEKAIEICKINNNKDILASCYVTIGIINFEQADNASAEKYYFKAIDLYRQIENKSKLAQVYNNLSNLYFQQNKLDEAIKYLDSSIDYYNESNNAAGMAVSYHNKATYLAELNRYNEAIIHLNKSIELKQKLGNFTTLGVSYLALAGVYNKMGKWSTAIEYTNKAKDVFIQQSMLKLLMECYSLQEEIYFQIHDYKSAYEILTKYNSLKDSIFNENMAVKIAELNTKYELSTKENENNILVQKAEKQNLTMIIIALVLFIFGILLLLYIIKNRTMSKINKVLDNNRIRIGKQNSELEKLNSDLKITNNDLHNLNATKDKFFSIISHDLKNPISSQNQLIDIIKENYDEFSDKEKKEYIELIHESSQNTFNLLVNLLVWGAVQMKRTKAHFSPFNLARVVQNTTYNLATSAFIKKIKINQNISEDSEIIGDVGMIATVIRNLINNSIKFTKSGGNITIGYQHIDDQHLITISDTGVGMSQEMICDLYKIEKSTSREGTNQEKGTGLGLIICKEFIDLHRGVINVESSVGVGTTFIISIPDNLQETI